MNRNLNTLFYLLLVFFSSPFWVGAASTTTQLGTRECVQIPGTTGCYFTCGSGYYCSLEASMIGSTNECINGQCCAYDSQFGDDICTSPIPYTPSTAGTGTGTGSGSGNAASTVGGAKFFALAMAVMCASFLF